MMSIGNWEYDGNANADLYNESQEYQGSSTLFLDGVKVGDAAQTTFALGADYSFLKGFKVGFNWRAANDLYSYINATDFTKEDNKGSLNLPSYDLFDLRASYKWDLGGRNNLVFSANVNNLFDELYISESDTNTFADPGDKTWKGIDTANRVYFGWGTSWNTTVRFRF